MLTNKEINNIVDMLLDGCSIFVHPYDLDRFTAGFSEIINRTGAKVFADERIEKGRVVLAKVGSNAE